MLSLLYAVVADETPYLLTGERVDGLGVERLVLVEV